MTDTLVKAGSNVFTTAFVKPISLVQFASRILSELSKAITRSSGFLHVRFSEKKICRESIYFMGQVNNIKEISSGKVYDEMLHASYLLSAFYLS